MALRLTLTGPDGKETTRRLGLSDENVATIPPWLLADGSDSPRPWVARPLATEELSKGLVAIQTQLQGVPLTFDTGEIASDSRCLWDLDPEDRSPALWIDLSPVMVVLAAHLALVEKTGVLRLESP